MMPVSPSQSGEWELDKSPPQEESSIVYLPDTGNYDLKAEIVG